MKLITKLILALTMIVSANTFASTAYYGLPIQTANKALTSYVAVYNYTYDIYTVHAVFVPSGIVIKPDFTLGSYHSGMDIVTYKIDYPRDTMVCLRITRNYDNLVTFPRNGQIGCLVSGNVNVNNPSYTLTNTPTVTITH